MKNTPAPTLAKRMSAAWGLVTGRRDWASGLFGTAKPAYAGAAINRLTAGLATSSASINADLDGALSILRARSRSEDANNEYAHRFIQLCGTNIVGRNHPKLQVQYQFKGEPDGATNVAVESWWDRYCATCDITGRHKSLSSLLTMIVCGVARDGEALIQKVRDSRGGLFLQVLDPERLDEHFNAMLSNGNTVRQGVEIDSAGRVVAYYIFAHHPGDSYAQKNPARNRVPADDIVHLYRQQRAEQIRGVPWMHAMLPNIQTLRRYKEAAVVAAEIGASKVMALTKKEGAPQNALLDGADGTSDGTPFGIPQFNVEAGEAFIAPDGYDLTGWNPEYPHANFDSFMNACLRGIAVAGGVASHNLTGNMNDVNFSSARIAEGSERDYWMALQEWVIDSFVWPLYAEALSLALLRGDVRWKTGSKINIEKLDGILAASRFQGRRWGSINPLDDASAAEKMVALGVTSRKRLVAERGDDFDDVVADLTAEKTAMAGLTPTPAPQGANPSGKSRSR